MFGNSFCFLFSKTCFWKEKKNLVFFNCFLALSSISKNNFLFLRLKNLFGNPKWIENKNCSQTQFVKETKNMQNAVFSF